MFPVASADGFFPQGSQPAAQPYSKTHLVGPVASPQLLDGLVSAPGQLNGQVQPSGLIGSCSSSMKGYAGRGGITDDGNQLATSQERLTLRNCTVTPRRDLLALGISFAQAQRGGWLHKQGQVEFLASFFMLGTVPTDPGHAAHPLLLYRNRVTSVDRTMQLQIE